MKKTAYGSGFQLLVMVTGQISCAARSGLCPGSNKTVRNFVILIGERYPAAKE
jgi:hypothetical protein